MRVFPVLPTLVFLACGPAQGTDTSAGSPGLATVIDSTGDSAVARVAGAVPARAVRRLEEVLRIAPAMDDTALFAEVFEFDVDRAGRLWVFDQASRSIFLFAADGRFLRRIGRQGGGPGEFNQNNGMVALGDTGLAILDARNARVSFLDSAGSFRTSWVVPAGFFTSNGLVTDRSGTFYLRRPVTPPREGEILGRMGLVRLGAGGAFTDSLAPPDLPVQREVYLAVRREGENVSQSSTGSQFAPNYHWTWHPDGYFVVAHGGRYEIILERPDRKPLVIRRDAPGIPVLEAERTEEQARITWNLRQTDPAWSWSGPALPTTKAPLTGLFVARDGRIWARVAAPSERIPEDERAIPRQPDQPVATFRTPVVYEVFSPEGRFLGRVEFARRLTLMEADGDQVWAIGRDADDLPAVLRFRIEPGLP